MREVADESRRRTEVAGFRKLSELSNRLGGDGRGRRAWPFPPIGRCCWRGIVHTKLRRPCAALPARVSGARQSSKLYARTCAEGDDASKPGPTCKPTGNPFFARAGLRKWDSQC